MFLLIAPAHRVTQKVTDISRMQAPTGSRPVHCIRPQTAIIWAAHRSHDGDGGDGFRSWS